MQTNLKQKTISGLIWKYAESISAQLVTTVVSIILARMLDPVHYGVIAIVNIFITLCNVFVETGLGQSLVQKKDADDLDFSSIFYVNVFLAIFLYTVIFISAPFISKFYGNEYYGLTNILRIMGLRIILASVNSIQNAKISRNLAFKKSFWVTLFGTVLSSFVGIFMAYSGFGTWALVAQYMTNSFIDTIMLLVFVRWIPKKMFSLERVKPLFQYGWKFLFSEFLTTLYNEIRSLLIGKVYSAEDLVFYSKGDAYPKLVVKSLNSAISTVLFPVFATVQNDRKTVCNILSRSLKTSSYIFFSSMTGLALVSEPFISILLTDKWLPCVPYLQIMCFAYAIMPLCQENVQCLVSLGESSLYLKIGILKKLIGILTLIVVFRINVLWIALSQVFIVVLEYMINAFTIGKKIGYGFILQIKDILPNIIITAVMGIIVFIIGAALRGCSSWIQLILQIFCGMLTFILISFVTRNETFYYILNIVKSMIFRKK